MLHLYTQIHDLRYVLPVRLRDKAVDWRSVPMGSVAGHQTITELLGTQLTVGKVLSEKFEGIVL